MLHPSYSSLSDLFSAVAGNGSDLSYLATITPRLKALTLSVPPSLDGVRGSEAQPNVSRLPPMQLWLGLSGLLTQNSGHQQQQQQHPQEQQQEEDGMVWLTAAQKQQLLSAAGLPTSYSPSVLAAPAAVAAAAAKPAAAAAAAAAEPAVAAAAAAADTTGPEVATTATAAQAQASDAAGAAETATPEVASSSSAAAVAVQGLCLRNLQELVLTNLSRAEGPWEPSVVLGDEVLAGVALGCPALKTLEVSCTFEVLRLLSPCIPSPPRHSHCFVH